MWTLGTSDRLNLLDRYKTSHGHFAGKSKFLTEGGK